MTGNSAEKALALEQCERDLDSAIERLINLRLVSELDAKRIAPDGNDDDHLDGTPAPTTAAVVASTAVETALPVLPSGGRDNNKHTKWVEEVIREMSSADDLHDARARAARLLEAFERSVAAERDAAVVWQNGVLKKAVLLQHRLHRAQEAANRELQRQLAGCQERVRSLETDNYVLSVYLRQAQPQPQGGAMSGRFHPEVF